MHRFFLSEQESRPLQVVPGEVLTLPDKVAHQAWNVLRLNVGEQIVLLDNSGDELLCRISRSGRSGVDVEFIERRVGSREGPLQIILCQGLLKSARFEWILEKGTELGVTTFAPILCRRSMSGLEEAGPAKIQRWQRIIQEATEQCGRTRRPALLPIRPLQQALATIPTGALAIMPWEEEEALSLHNVLQADRQARTPERPEHKSTVEAPIIVLFIGPEGGLTGEEVTLARQHGVQVATLGKRILRAETAALASVANVMYDVESWL